MTNYLLTNLGLGILVLTGLLLLRTAPPRPKMWMCLVAAAAWCVPWPVLSAIWESNELFVQYVRFDGLQTLPDSAVDLAPLVPVVSISWESVFAVATAAGLLFFLARLLVHRAQLKAMQKATKLVPNLCRLAGSDNSAVPIHVVDDLDNAFVSGYFRPRIWIGQSQLESAALPSILQHEFAHIRQHDNLILLFVTLLTDLFWWNPLLRILTRQARRYVELSCDLACHKSFPEYRADLAGELLNRKYRTLESTLINPISLSSGFNMYRIRQLAKETSMQFRHFFLFGLLAIASVLLVSNIAVSQVLEDEPQIVTHLKVTTITPTSDGGKNTKSLETEIVAEAEIEKLLQLAKTADVTVETRMENEFRRVVVIESRDLAETHKVLAAFENTGLHNLYNNRVVRDTGRHIFLDLGFQVTNAKPYDVKLAPNIGEWTGVTVGDYLLRIKPDLLGARGQETVLLSTEISEINEGNFNLIATPTVETRFGHEAVIQFGETGGPGTTLLSLTLLPRRTL